MEYCSSAWEALYKKIRSDRKVSAQIYQYGKYMEGKSYEDRLRYLGLWTLEEKRNKQDLIELFKILKGLSRVRVKLFMLDENMKGTRGHCLKLRKTRCTRDITRHFFLIGWSTDGTCWISGQSMHLV